MREASACRTATDTDSYVFLYKPINANEGMTAAPNKLMSTYRVAFMVNGKQLNAYFMSPESYSGESANKSRLKEMAIRAVQEYLREARSVPSTGTPTELAIWPEILPSQGPIQPLDAFEITD